MKKPDERGLKLPLRIYAERKEITFNWPLDDRTWYLAIFNHVWKRQLHFSTAALTLSFKGLRKRLGLGRDLLPPPQNLHFSWLLEFQRENKTKHVLYCVQNFTAVSIMWLHHRWKQMAEKESRPCRCENKSHRPMFPALAGLFFTQPFREHPTALWSPTPGLGRGSFFCFRGFQTASREPADCSIVTVDNWESF